MTVRGRKRLDAIDAMPEKVYLVVPVSGGPVAYASWSFHHAQVYIKRARGTGDFIVVGPYTKSAAPTLAGTAKEDT